MATQLEKRQTKTPAPVGQQLAKLHEALKVNKAKIFAGVPQHVSQDRMIVAAVRAIRENPELANCSPESFCASVAKAAFMGWEIGGVLAQCYLVPFRDKERGLEATLIPGYRGLLDLCRRSNQIGTITHRLVHKGDHFRHVMGDDEKIEHTPSSAEDRIKQPVTHVYVIVELVGGGRQREVWTAAEINDHKERHSKGWQRKDSPWQTHWGTMAYKTIVRDMVMRGKLPMSAELIEARDAMKREDEIVGATSWISEMEDGAPEHDNTADYAAVLSEAKLKIDSAESLTAVDDVVFAHDQLLDAKHSEELAQYATARKDVIRGGRGERSNSKK